MEMSWTPSSARGEGEDEGLHVLTRKGKKTRRDKTSLGIGLLEKGVEKKVEMSEQERKGRTERRKGVRSGSKNVFRRLG
jgi:ribosome biogenesis protein ENP2